MPSSFTTNKGLEKPANGEYVDTWNVPVNGDMDIIDQSLGGMTSLNATAGSAILTASQYRSLMLSVTGAMSANVTYTIPSGIGGQWIVRNTTTDGSGGPWTVTIDSGGGGTSVVAIRGQTTVIFSDGTNIRTTTPSIGSNNQIIFNSSGSLAGSNNLTWNGTALTVTGAGSFSEGFTVGTTILVVDKTNSRVGVNVASPTEALDVSGNIKGSGSISDSIGNVRTVIRDNKTTSYTLVATDSGKLISITTGGVTVPQNIFTAGQTISIYNNSASPQTITQGTGVSLRLAGFATTGNKTLAGYGLATIVCVDSNVFVMGGGGVS